MKVRNINNTTENTCNCFSWLEHWKKFSGRILPNYCPEETCHNKPEVGAHVQKDTYTDNDWYIIPLCKKHNAQRGQVLIVSDYIELVSANVSKTCGK